MKNAARRKLQQELGITPEQIPLDSMTFLTRVHYRASCKYASKLAMFSFCNIFIYLTINGATNLGDFSSSSFFFHRRQQEMG